MPSKKYTTSDIIMVKVPAGEKIPEYLVKILRVYDIPAACITGIGGFKRAKIGFYKPTLKEYDIEEIEAEPGYILEVLSLKGNTVRGPDGQQYPHLHVVLAKHGGEAVGGHLIEAEVEPFLELMIVAVQGPLEPLHEMFSHRWRGL